MVVFDPYLSSRQLAEAIRRLPEGKLIVDHHGKEPYYNFASVFFYLDRDGLLINGQYQNLAYGAAAPGAPDVFIDEATFKKLWQGPERYYLVAEKSQVPVFQQTVGAGNLEAVIESGGKVVMANHPLSSNALQEAYPQLNLMRGAAHLESSPRHVSGVVSTQQEREHGEGRARSRIAPFLVT